MKKKTLMITGATGFIGSNFIKKYENDYNIISVDLRKNNPEDLDLKNVDTVLHLAALVHQMKGAPEHKYYEVNTELTKRLAVKAKNDGVKHFVFFSTVAVYGTHGSLDSELILSIDSSTIPKDHYGKSKLLAEQILEQLEDKNFKVAIIRPPMVYGKNCPGNMRKLEKLVNIFPILPFNYNKNKRTIVHINKLLEITNEKIKNMESGTFIPKDEKDVSIKEIIESFGKKRILIKFPKFIFNTLVKFNSKMMESLYGSLILREEI